MVRICKIKFEFKFLDEQTSVKNTLKAFMSNGNSQLSDLIDELNNQSSG
jgi:hypothetical protein